MESASVSIIEGDAAADGKEHDEEEDADEDKDDEDNEEDGVGAKETSTREGREGRVSITGVGVGVLMTI